MAEKQSLFSFLDLGVDWIICANDRGLFSACDSVTLESAGEFDSRESAENFCVEERIAGALSEFQ